METVDERVAVTREMCLSAMKMHGVRLVAGSEAKLIAKQTHLHLHGHKPLIEALVDLRVYGFKALEVLYLYDNALQSPSLCLLQSLGSTLKLLYLNNNDLDSLEGLAEGNFDLLTKLYLQGNRISHITGLKGMKSLEELHLNGQRLPPDSSGLTFDLKSMVTVSQKLKVLTANDCGITDESAASLPRLFALKKLELKGNRIEVIEAIETVLRGAARLQSLDLLGNPFACSKTAPIRYRDSVILMASDSLSTLDGEDITSQQRSFLLNLNVMRLKKEMAAVKSEGGEQQT